MKAHTCAAVGFVLALIVSPAAVLASPEPLQGQAQTQRNNMRFRAMDTDGDGRITRAEWRGNARSFRNHDWNNDGVLSGDELRPGAAIRRGQNPDDTGFYEWTRPGFRSLDVNRDNRITRNEWQHDYELFLRADRNRDNVLTLAEFLGNENTDLDREDRFADLDTNNNNRIERAEWHGTRDAFDWLDRNNDGRLSREETVGNDVPVGTSGRGDLSRDVVVDPQTRWTDTGITVRAGDRLRVQADGTVTLSNNTDDVADIAGARSGRRAANAPLPQMPAGGLIARIGDSEPFFVGDRNRLERAATSGRLFLGVNDDHLPDNRGEFRVTISVIR